MVEISERIRQQVGIDSVDGEIDDDTEVDPDDLPITLD